MSARTAKPRGLCSDTRPRVTIASTCIGGSHRILSCVLVVLVAFVPAIASVGLNDVPNEQSNRFTTMSFANWALSTLDSVGDVGYHTSIAVDSHNRVYVGYYDKTNRDLKYATNASGQWTSYMLDSQGDVGQYASIAIDSGDNIHISYLDWTNSNLKYATNQGGSWAYYTLDSTGDVGISTSIALDSNNVVHISYLDWTNWDLKYATNAGGSWSYYTLDSLGDVGYDTSIAVDSNNKVHISYGDWTDEDLKYATNSNGSWECYALDSNGSVGFDPSIAVDANNKIHISYHDETNARLKYATNVNGSWTCYTLDSSGNVGLYTSIAVDSSNKVHISYTDYTDFANADLKYATNTGGSWANYTLDAMGDVGLDTSIAVDSKRIVHISYADFTNANLKYAFGTAGEIPGLVVTIGANMTSGKAPLTVQFAAHISGGLEPYTCNWTFGDEGTDSSPNPVHTYVEVGKYTLTLIVTDSLSNSRTVEKTITATEERVVPGSGDDLYARVLTIATIAAIVLAGVFVVAVISKRRRTTATEGGLKTRDEPARPEQALGSEKPRLVRVEDRLFQLRTMKEKGLISEEECEQKTKDLLKRW